MKIRMIKPEDFVSGRVFAEAARVITRKRNGARAKRRARMRSTIDSYLKKEHTIQLSNGHELRHFQTKLNRHALSKMMQAQDNFMSFVSGGRAKYRSNRARYWSRQFKKWSDILIVRPMRAKGYE